MGLDAEAPRVRRVLNLHFRKAGAVEEEAYTVTLRAGVHEKLQRVFSEYAAQDRGHGQGRSRGAGSGGATTASLDELRFMARGQVGTANRAMTPKADSTTYVTDMGLMN